MSTYPENAHPILVVDDDESIRTMVHMALLDEGYDAITSINGADALKIVDQIKPALILLDMRMPVMDGWQFAQAYRQMPAPHAPIITLTAARDAAVSAQQIQADNYLSKPFSLDALLEMVSRYVTRT